MYHQHTIAIIVFIHLFHWISGLRIVGFWEQECFPNINGYEDGYCQCKLFSPEVSCNIKAVPSDHIFWDRFSHINGFPTTITVNVMQPNLVSYFPLNLFLNLPDTVNEVKLKGWSFESIPKIPVAEIAANIKNRSSTPLQLKGWFLEPIPEIPMAKKTSNMSSLTLLEITGNENLTTISPLAFSSITSLQKLILSSNALSSLAVNSFSNLTKLRDLKLDNNKIVSLPNKIFKSLEQLGNLTLDHNEITSIRRETFIGLNSLQDLDLNRNKLLIIKNDTFHEMRKLRTLDLSHNVIDTTEQAAFRGLIALETLDLSDNQLRHLPDGTFKYTGNLTYVDLKNNQLTKLDFDLFNQLPKIAYLKDNPWICDCSLFINIEKVVQFNAHTTCEYDIDLNGNGQLVKYVSLLFKKFADLIEGNPEKAEKCLQSEKKITKSSHEIEANNYAVKSIKSSSNQLMPFMSFIFIIIYLDWIIKARFSLLTL